MLAIGVFFANQGFAENLYCNANHGQSCVEARCSAIENPDASVLIPTSETVSAYQRCNGSGEDCTTVKIVRSDRSGFYRTLYSTSGSFIKISDDKDYMEVASAGLLLITYWGICE